MTRDGVVTVLYRQRRRGGPPPDVDRLALALSTEDVASVRAAAGELLAEGRIERDGDGFRLADAHLADARGIARRTMAARFGEALVRSDGSPAYRELCRRAYRLPFPHFGDVDRDELARTIDALGPVGRVLDLGCGTGALAEHLAATTGAEVLGVDFAEAPIALARSRAGPRTTYAVADLDELEPEGPFDAIVAFDTLYFPEDLPRLVAACARALRPGGRLVAPCRVAAEDGEPSRFAAAMRAAGLVVAAEDETVAALETWRRTDVALRELEAAFRAEGAAHLWIGRRRECDDVLARHAAGLARRYRFVAVRP